MGRAVKVEVPDGFHEEVKRLVKQGKYRSISDFFYVAGQKELDRVVERLRTFEKKDQKSEEVVA